MVTQHAGMWLVATASLVLLVMTFSWNGTWLGGISVGWILTLAIILAAAAIWLAPRGPGHAVVHRIMHRKPPTPPNKEAQP